MVETHERAVFLKSLGRKGKMLEIYESPSLPLLFYRSTATIHVHTYAVREGANPFTFPTPRFYSIQAFPISRLDNRANNGQGQIIFAPQPLSPTSGWSVDIPDIIVFDGDFRSSAKRLYLLIEQALNRAWPSPHVGRNEFLQWFESVAASISYRIIHIYIYSLVLPDYSFPEQDISQGELRVHVARGAIETNIRNVEIRGNVWAGGLAS